MTESPQEPRPTSPPPPRAREEYVPPRAEWLGNLRDLVAAKSGSFNDPSDPIHNRKKS